MLPDKVDIIVEDTAEIDKVVRIYSINSIVYFFLYNSTVLIISNEIEKIRSVSKMAVFKRRWPGESMHTYSLVNCSFFLTYEFL